MKRRAWLAIPLALALAGAVEAADIRACAGDGAIASQNMPCTGTQADAGLLRLPDYADPAQRDGASAPTIQDVPAGIAPVEAPAPYAPEPAAPDAQQGYAWQVASVAR